MYPPWFWGPPMPYPTEGKNSKDPMQTFMQFLRWQERKEEKKKEKDKDKDKKKHESIDQLLQASAVIFIMTFLVGPLVYTVYHLATH